MGTSVIDQFSHVLMFVDDVAKSGAWYKSALQAAPVIEQHVGRVSVAFQLTKATLGE